MSGETKSDVSSWTIDSLKEFLLAIIQQTRVALEAGIEAAAKANQQRFDAQQQAIKDALISAKEAVLVAEQNAEKWRMNANEWRGSMLDRETKFASRVEVDAKFETVVAQIASLKETRAEGAGSKSTILLLFGAISAAATLIAIFFALRGRV